VEGQGAKCPFPGNKESWKALYNEPPQDMVARFSILTSFRPEQTGGKPFNVAGQEESRSGKWPIICEYFELVGPPPEENSPQLGQYIKGHRAQWEDLENRTNLRDGYMDNSISHSGFQYFIMTLLDFDRHMDMSASRSIGYAELINTKECWRLAFDRMRKAGIIP
jgi:hypothetical protein